MQSLMIYVLIAVQIACCQSSVWYKKHYTQVTGSTGDFATALNKQAVSFWEGSGEMDIKQSIDSITKSLPVAVNQNQLSSFMKEISFSDVTETVTQVFWIDLELKQGELHWIILQCKNGKIKYYAIKAGTSIPDHGHYQQDCTKKRRLFWKKKKCGASYFVSDGLQQVHIDLVRKKLADAIKSKPKFKQITSQRYKTEL